MIAFSKGETRQHLRSLLPLAERRVLGIMPGALGERAAFGAKLISIYPENFKLGRPSHQGLVILFDPETGAPVCVVDAGEITAIRTASASAVATDALARSDAHRLTILGYGHQAGAHAAAMTKVRNINSITVWGRDPERSKAFCVRMSEELHLPVRSAIGVEEAVSEADIICTVTASPEPILKGAWVRPGTHVNVVGSSFAGPAEVDDDLVAGARFIVDSREGVLLQGAEFLRAKASGRIDDGHIVAEIGQVLAGDVEGRRTNAEITVYKSLGHVVQDLASAWALYSDAGQGV